MKLAKLLGPKAVVVAAEMPEDPQERARARLRRWRADGPRARARFWRPTPPKNSPIFAMAIWPRFGAKSRSWRRMPGRAVRSVAPTSPRWWFPRRNIRCGSWPTCWRRAARSSAFTFLDNLLREGEQPPALVGAMAWMFRKLMEAQDLGPHATEYQAAGRLGMRAATAKMALQQARKIPAAATGGGPAGALRSR